MFLEIRPGVCHFRIKATWSAAIQFSEGQLGQKGHVAGHQGQNLPPHTFITITEGRLKDRTAVSVSVGARKNVDN